MTARIIPAGSFTVQLEDMTVDLVCFQYAMYWLNDRKQAGKLTGYLEATYDANPGLAGLGIVLPRGTVVQMPEFIISTEIKTVRLWD